MYDFLARRTDLRIADFEWDEGNTLHLQLGHGINPEETEEVFANRTFFRKTKKGYYAAFGLTFEVRYLTIVFELKPKGTARPITGGGMSRAELRYYKKQRNKKMNKQAPKSKSRIRYYDDQGILNEITDEPIDLILDKRLREDILTGKRKRNLKNVTIKIDPLQVKAIKKLATMKSIPYQTLIRSWLAEGIKSEMDSVLK